MYGHLTDSSHLEVEVTYSVYVYNTKHRVQKSTEHLYAFLWVIPRRLNFICRSFGMLCLSHLHRRMGVKFLHLSAYEDGTDRVF